MSVESKLDALITGQSALLSALAASAPAGVDVSGLTVAITTQASS